MSGNYMGFIDFDDHRYFDVRQMDVREIIPIDIESKFCLKSDSRNRIDSLELRNNDVE